MRLYRFLSLTITIFLLAGCSGKPGNPFSNATLPAPQVGVTPPPDGQRAMQSFLDAWKADDYATMYGLLSQDSQNSITLEDFDKAYRNAMNSLTLKELQYSIGPITKNTDSAQVSFQLTYKTNLLGDLQRDMKANLTREKDQDQWRIAWDDSLIMPELRGGNHLSMAYDVPARGSIYDREGTALVSQSEALALGLTPGEILPEQEGQLLANLSILTGLYPGTIASLYASAGPDWYIPVGEASLDDFNRYYGVLLGFNGLQWTQYNTRLYSNGVAPHAIGYISPIQAEEVDQYLRLGYSPATRIGRIGIEKWGESYLAGKPGGTLHVAAPDGAILASLGKKDPEPASSINLTIDRNMQFQAQKAIEGFRGAIVVLERDSGRVLAMASSPGYDPNFFDPGNRNSGNGLTNLVNDPETPLVNRASQGEYPLGSVFKVVTFAAGLESGTYTPDVKYDCQYEWNELPDQPRYDWTWDHYQDELAAGETDGFTRPSGILTYSEGLMRSCNPWFWHIGKGLFDQGRVTAIATMARGFGLGKETGIGEIEEEAGTITDPAGQVEAVNQAIGQGDVEVTPLQVARMMAAIGNGGTLYRPQLVEQIVDPAGNATQVFKPEAQGVLPITFDTLTALREAMRSVVRNPRGTAYRRFQGTTAGYPIYGKTGTAESGSGSGIPHAWFAGYTDVQNPDLPDIAIAVIVENIGEGSEFAAPMFKRMVEVYFTGQPRSPYSWESSIGITRTPTGPVTPTSEP
jgi:cell division protein FtsI/penicillin-binding protein 2